MFPTTTFTALVRPSTHTSHVPPLTGPQFTNTLPPSTPSD
uniref:Uncharacterized protein n=1 Tax=Fusarium solani partitivirus 3 TaxID=3237256 RepID=A0AB39A6J6_9VIRU